MTGLGPYNLVRTGLESVFPASNSNIILGASTDARVDSVLRNLGGPTAVLPLLSGSAALDAIPGAPIATVDQRGIARPQFGGKNLNNSDIGAYESLIARFETETLVPAAAKSAVGHVVVSNPNYSNGQGTNLQANAAGQFVTYSSAATVPAATYKVTVGFKKSASAGQFQLAIGPSVSGPWVTLPVQNAHASADSWATVTFSTNVTASTTGTKFFRFMVPTGSPSPFQIFPDFVELARQ